MYPTLVYWIIVVSVSAIGAYTHAERVLAIRRQSQPTTDVWPKLPALTEKERARHFARLSYMQQLVVTQTTQSAVIDAKLVGLFGGVLVIWAGLATPLFIHHEHPSVWIADRWHLWASAVFASTLFVTLLGLFIPRAKAHVPIDPLVGSAPTLTDQDLWETIEQLVEMGERNEQTMDVKNGFLGLGVALGRFGALAGLFAVLSPIFGTP